MSKIIKCSIIIYDDFNNVLLIQKGKGKKGILKPWTILNKEIKENSDSEKHIIKEINRAFKCNIFSLKVLNEYEIDGTENSEIVYTGLIRESITTNSDIKATRWVNQSQLKDINFEGNERAILEDFFKNNK